MAKTSLRLAFVLSLVFFLAPPKVYAYLDPGSGSYLVQIIIASIAGLGYLVKLKWGKIKTFFSSTGKKGAKDENQDSQS